MTRLQATVALLQAWLDYFPWPETWTGELQRKSTSAGPAPFRRVDCEECQGRGKTRSGWMCSTCKGRGRYDVDDYTLGIVDTSITPWSDLLQRFVNCSTCGGWGRLSADANTRPSNEHPFCDDCNGTGRVPAPFTGVFRADLGASTTELSGDATVDALDRGHERRDSLAVYQHLHAALENLADLDAYGHLLVQWVWVLGAQTPESLHPRATVRLVNGTRAVEAVMPERFERQLPGEIRAQYDHRQASLVRAKGKSADRFAQAKRDDEIRRLYSTGSWTHKQLAEKFNTSRVRITQVLNRKG